MELLFLYFTFNLDLYQRNRFHHTSNYNTMRSISIQNVLLVFMTCIVVQFCSAQKFIQLELPGDPIASKYYEGSSIAYKLVDYPDEFFNKRIEKIDIENNLLVFDDGFINVDDITHIRRFRPWAKALGYSLNTFGVVWIGYGALGAAFVDDDDRFGDEGSRFGWDTAIIGTTAIVAGWILRKWLYKKDYKIGKHARLRMLDITMPTSEEIYGPR